MSNVETLFTIFALISAACTIENALATSDIHLQSEKLCSQCSYCDSKVCPPSEAYPHMTAFDDSIIAGALQSDLVPVDDRGVYAVPNVKGGESQEFNAYFGWQSTSGSVDGFHKFSNYMDKCSDSQNYLSVIDKFGTVGLRSLSSLENQTQADWKTINPPSHLDHQGLRIWKNGYSGKCLTVLRGKNKQKRSMGVTECKFDGSNPYQLFAFRFHYHKAFCCCGKFIG